MIFIVLLATIMVIGSNNTATAQNPLTLSLTALDESAQTFVRNNPASENFQDAAEVRQWLRSQLAQAQSSGYLGASFDSVQYDSTHVNASLRLGRQYMWAYLKPAPELQDWLSELGIQSDELENRALNPRAFEATMSRILNFAENHGHPFAQLFLDSISLDKEVGISARLKVYKNRFFRFDSIRLNGDARVSENFLYQYLGFRPGDVYREDIVRKLDEKLGKLPYLTIKRRSTVNFIGNAVRINVYLDHRPTDQVDGIVGFAPNSTADNSLLVTGEANIDLKNLLKRGIGYSLHWKSFAAQSQQLKMGAQLPFLFRSPIGVDGLFEYVKFDTQFFTLKTGLGVKYLFEGTDFVKVYFQNHQSALLELDTSLIRTTASIPSSNPVSSTSYGVQMLRQKLDVPNNPRRGFSIGLDANVWYA